MGDVDGPVTDAAQSRRVPKGTTTSSGGGRASRSSIDARAIPTKASSREIALRAAHRALEGDEAVAVVVILQRLGTGRLLACARCGELARCAQCQQAEEEVGDEIACAERHEPTGAILSPLRSDERFVACASA